MKHECMAFNMESIDYLENVRGEYNLFLLVFTKIAFDEFVGNHLKQNCVLGLCFFAFTMTLESCHGVQLWGNKEEDWIYRKRLNSQYHSFSVKE